MALEQPEPETLRQAAQNARQELLRRLTTAGHWEGHLSSSALATAVAVAALALIDSQTHAGCVRRGLGWLAANQNPDGGWGDTSDSPSNLSTTLLCWAACHHVPGPATHRTTLSRAREWLQPRVGSLKPEEISAQVLSAYGKDRTFSVPILTFCALSETLGEPERAWAGIPQLPFELAALPHQLFKWLRLPVVSYAVPALIAIGLACHEHRKRRFSPLRGLRDSLKPQVLEILRKMQPASGGFLEAIPLTGFVVSALAASGWKEHPVTIAGAEFLTRAVRADGSWPIDVNLSTWVTTLGVGALSASKEALSCLDAGQREALLRWLLGQQRLDEDPFTHAAPGGWAWTDLPGGVPDGDDTAGVLLALHALDAALPEVQAAARRGIRWLLDLQNRDGGIPTFCRGWSNLPFDRSCPDLTAHALAAWSVWLPGLEPGLNARVRGASRRALRYLFRVQRTDGSWVPLWFGNQHAVRMENPLYGTARVLQALRRIPGAAEGAGQRAVARSREWLLRSQRGEGGWGGAPGAPPGVEETALALDALLGSGCQDRIAIRRGLGWLLERTGNGTLFPAAPIGLYFAALWYSEELYPLIFTCSALGRAAQTELSGNSPQT